MPNARESLLAETGVYEIPEWMGEKLTPSAAWPFSRPVAAAAEATWQSINTSSFEDVDRCASAI